MLIGAKHSCGSDFRRSHNNRTTCESEEKRAGERGDQSPSVSSEALPPAAVVLTVTTFSVAKRSR
jgi:HTH-type transcriptional regulator, transcriptional repressor of NAD biosynthesis genes